MALRMNAAWLIRNSKAVFSRLSASVCSSLNVIEWLVVLVLGMLFPGDQTGVVLIPAEPWRYLVSGLSVTLRRVGK
jgi:hypothetical protein